MSDYLSTAGAGVELDCTENNSVSSNPGKQTTSLVNGLFLADSICSAINTEFNSVVWWDLRNGQETTNNNSATLYGWRQYGDYGVVDSTDPAGPADRYPTFYVDKLLKNFARGGDQLVSSASDYALLSVCAAQRIGGSLTMLVINKSATAALNSNISISGATPGSTGTALSYGIPQDDAAQTGSGSADIATTPITGLGTNFSYNFPAYSATVIAFGTSAPPPPVYQPDNLIEVSGGSYVGANIFSTDGTGETVSRSVKAGSSGTFLIKTQNDGSAADSFTLKGSGSSGAFTVKYYSGASGGTDITTAVIAGTYKYSSVAPGGSMTMRLVVTVARKTAVGTNQGFLVTATSVANPAKSDTVKASVTSK